MKYNFKILIISVLTLILPTSFYGQSDIYESFAILDVNNTGNTYYDLNTNTANPNFNGLNLGTLTPSNSLILNGAQNKTYKCGTHNIINGFIEYRVYLNNVVPPAFTSSQVLFDSIDGTSNYCTGSSIDETWDTNNANIDLISGLPSGNYTLEVYTRADIDINNDNIIDNTLVNNNGGSNFIANFRIDNPPNVTCQNITIQLDAAGNASISPNDIRGSSSDDFGIPTLTASQTSFDCSDIGTNNVTLTITDIQGQTDTCIAVVTVEDITPPATPTLTDITSECSANITTPTTTDICGGTITGTTSDPLTYNIQGTYIITWNFDDGNGNSINVNQSVIIDDVTPPVTPTLPNVTIECSTPVNAPTTTDNCGGLITGTTSDPLTYNTQGTHIITWNFDDGNGNNVNANQNVIINDVTFPNAVCQNITVQLDAFGNATIVPADIDNGSSDNCGIASMSLDVTTFDCSNLGANTVTLSVTDSVNNTSTCTATVTITDPSINSSVSIVVDNNPICFGESATFTATPVNGGSSPIYEWFINNVSQGNNSSIFTPFISINNGDVVFVEMQASTSSCSSVKQSNSITMNVNALPVVSGPSNLCIGNSAALSPANVGWTSNTGLATVDNTGVVTATSSGIATFTYTDANGCSSDITITINDTPVVTAPISICVNETSNLTPNSGGSWTSSDSTIATVTNTGAITGVSSGYVTFSYTDGNNCSATTTTVEVLPSPIINLVTASDTQICGREPSILTANVTGGILNETIINYNFNTGTNYNQLDGQEAPGISCDVSEVNFIYRTGSGTATQANAYEVENTAGNALRQRDNNRRNDEGYITFDLTGPNLSNYQDFSIYFQTKRANSYGDDKYVYVFYRVNGVGGLVLINQILVNNTVAGTQWQEAIVSIPVLANNPTQLEFMIGVDDGYEEFDDTLNPDILIDNVQLQASLGPDVFTYAWTANTGTGAGLPPNASTASSTNDVITVNPEVTTEYTVTVTNSNGCTETENITVNAYPSPIITIAADYCPVDDPSTAQNEANMVQLVASSTVPITNWTWLTEPFQTNNTNTIYVDASNNYQVIGTTADGCSESASISVAQERVFNGDFSNTVAGVNGDFGPDAEDNLLNVGFDFDEDYIAPFNAGYRYFADGTLPQNGLNTTVNPLFLGTDFFSVSDHTNDAAARFLAVNGGNSTHAVWRQEISVLPGESYYFSAWGIDISDLNNAALGSCDLRFRINGVEVGSTLNLVKGNPWERFNGNWNSGIETTAIVEIITKNTVAQGNNFGLDDISFATLSTFIKLTSDPTLTENQTVCQNSPIIDITYDVGGGLTAPSVTGLPAGLTTTFDGLELTISGTPTQFGTFNYTIATTSSCDVKTETGTIIIEEAPTVTIQPIASPICASVGNIAVNSILSGTATSGSWTTSGNGTFSGVSADGTTATYNFGFNETGIITLTFTSNAPSALCSTASDSLDFEITPSIYANAGLDIDYSASNCANTTVTLAANNVSGQWSVTSGQLANSYHFSDVNAYNSTFTGESGETYTLQWEATNTSPCTNLTDLMIITFANCGISLVFDGAEDYISLGNNYGLESTPFSIETWIKVDNVSGVKTIISKRDANDLNSGYDLSLFNNRLYFRWNNQAMFSTQTINNSKWYHLAITYNGTNTYTMYIDGFVMRTVTNGTPPIANTNQSLIGAMDRNNNTPINYFNGDIDEVRFWNRALSQNQVHEMMNQEIKNVGGKVDGEIIPLDIIGGLQWNELIGYYQMRQGAQSIVANGYIEDISTVSPVQGKLNRMTTIQTETAPIPYYTANNTNWDSQNTWLNGASQQIPNSTINSINGFAQTWNIVVSQHNVTTNRATELLGLVVNSNRLSITNNQPIQVNKYLKLNGTLDLVDESQLLQPLNSIVDYTGTGKLERDQQGTANLFNYNYWTSPVSDNGTTFTIAGSLFDGTTVANPQALNWTSAHNANPSTSPITISRRWLYLYENYLNDSYADWNSITENSTIQVGLGYSMKGSGSSATDQNYTFIGQPNNGTINSPISGGYQALVGNPYPSAIDANAFINNNSGVLLDGTLYFWEHAASNTSHVLTEYEGGYATRNLLGGVAAVSPPEVNSTGNANKIPRRYVPVAQGFFVTGNASGGQITFNNSQRIFAKESGSNSTFFRSATSVVTTSTNDGEEENNDQFLRLDFITPENAKRHLLLGFMDNENATDGVNYGYDAINQDNFPSDMSFNIEGGKYIIQGVGNFDNTKSYPLDISIANDGPIEIVLTDLENFDESIDVFIYDNILGTYTQINNQNFQLTLEAGNYSNRFYLVFQEGTTLSTIKDEFESVIVRYLNSTDEIYVKTPPTITVKQLYLINTIGQTVASWNATNLPMTDEIKIAIKNISAGAYILKAETDTSSFNKKIIIK